MIRLGGMPVRDSGQQMLNVMREVAAAAHLDQAPLAENIDNSILLDLQTLECIAEEPFDASVVLERMVRGAHQD